MNPYFEKLKTKEGLSLYRFVFFHGEKKIVIRAVEPESSEFLSLQMARKIMCRFKIIMERGQA